MVQHLKSRFEKSYRVTPGCWIWLGALSDRGYGKFGASRKEKWQAHRLSYEIYKGEIPEGLVIRHRCDNPCCVNPEHLLAGTQGDNIRDSVERGLMPRGEAQGSSKLTEASVLQIRDLCSSGLFTRPQIGRWYGVARQTVNDVHSRRQWKHV